MELVVVLSNNYLLFGIPKAPTASVCRRQSLFYKSGMRGEDYLIAHFPYLDPKSQLVLSDCVLPPPPLR